MLLSIFEKSMSRWKKIMENFLRTPEVDFRIEHKPTELWLFAWDGEKVIARLYNEKKLKKLFKEVSKIYREDANKLMYHNFIYLLLHEAPGHQYFSPRSKIDAQKISKALYEGMLRSCNSKAEAFQKAWAFYNLALDYIDDTVLYEGNGKREEFVDGTWLIFDAVNLLSDKEAHELYRFTRLPYIEAFVRNPTLKKKLKKLVEWEDKEKWEKFKKIVAEFSKKQSLDEALYEIFLGEKRYGFLEKFAELCADLTPTSPVDRIKYGLGLGTSTSISSFLENLIEELSEEDAVSLLEELIESGSGSSSDLKPPMKEISFLYYDKVSKPIEILVSTQFEGYSPGKELRIVSEGKKIIDIEGVSKLDWRTLLYVQEQIKKPVLIPIGNGFFIKQEIEFEVDDIRSYRRKPAQDLPENIIFLLDSSGSMGFDKVGDGSKYDILCRVTFGILKSIKKVSELMGKKPKIAIGNFSNSTIISPLESIDAIYSPKLMDYLRYQGFTTYLDISKLEPYLNLNGRSFYVLVSDGGICNWQEVENFILRLVKNEKNFFAFVEVEDRSGFDADLKHFYLQNLLYINVDKVEEIEEKLGKIILSYGT